MQEYVRYTEKRVHSNVYIATEPRLCELELAW